MKLVSSGAHFPKALNHVKATTPGKKISKERISVLCCTNADGVYGQKLAAIRESAHPRVLKDCMNDLSVLYYHSKNAWLTEGIFSDWLCHHFVPDVCRYQEEVLKIKPEDVKALLLVDPSKT